MMKFISLVQRSLFPRKVDLQLLNFQWLAIMVKGIHAITSNLSKCGMCTGCGQIKSKRYQIEMKNLEKKGKEMSLVNPR